MIINSKWLAKYTPIPYDKKELEARLTALGLEAVLRENPAEKLDTVVVAKVLEVGKHPNADKLTVCKVDNGAAVLDVVCGASNVSAGQKVPLALVGTRFSNGIEIKSAKIRGIRSVGMLCAEDELGISDDHSGIMILDCDAEIGTKLKDYLDRNGATYDIDLTPNRPDCTSHIGVARDIALLTGGELKKPVISLHEADKPVAAEITIEIQNAQACPRYVARLIKGVKIGPSPKWMRDALRGVGLRSINNVVDAANYVLLETGQPLHTFDYRDIEGQKIVVRNARNGEEVETLDGVHRELTEDILLICDALKPVAVAGIMGLANSEIKDDTTDILIESAYFDPGTIRKGSRMLALQTEASYRFERGADPEGTIYAANRVTQLIQELAGGEIYRGLVDAYPRSIVYPRVKIRFHKVNGLIGIDIDKEWTVRLLKGLGCDIVGQTDEFIEVISPSWRPDLEREVDYIEEVVRVYGMETVPACERLQVTPDPVGDPTYALIEELRARIGGYGYTETYCNSLVSQEQAHFTIEPVQAVKLCNPLNQEMAYLRTSMIPGLLLVAKRNFNRRNFDLNLFELGNVQHLDPEFETRTRETLRLALLISGNLEEMHWGQALRQNDLFVLKGIVEVLAEEYGIRNLAFKVQEHPDYENLIRVIDGEVALGYIGQLNPGNMKRDWDIEQAVFIMEIDAMPLILSLNRDRRYRPLPVYPSIERDISIVLPEDIPVAQVIAKISEKGGQYLTNVKFYDLYKGKNIDKGLKSFTFNLVFQAEEKTLQDSEIDEIMQVVYQTLEKELNAKLR